MDIPQSGRMLKTMTHYTIPFDKIPLINSDLVTHVIENESRVSIQKNGKTVAVILSQEELDFFETLEDQRDREEARSIMADETDELIPWKDAVKMLDDHGVCLPQACHFGGTV